MQGRRCILKNAKDLQQRIMKEAHNLPYSVHTDKDKLYKDFHQYYWWHRMKRDVAEFIARCLTYQKVKTEYKRPMGLFQSLNIPEWK